MQSTLATNPSHQEGAITDERPLYVRDAARLI